jgi:hypothetical protein
MAPPGKEGEALAQRADREGFDALDDVALPQHQLGRGAADVEHQARGVRVRQGGGHAHVDQASGLVAGDQLDRAAQGSLRCGQEDGRVARHAQRRGGDHAHGLRPPEIEGARELAQAGQRAPHGGLAQAAIVLEGGGQGHPLGKRGFQVKLAALDAGDVEAKTVGAEFDGGVAGKGAGIFGKMHRDGALAA